MNTIIPRKTVAHPYMLLLYIKLLFLLFVPYLCCSNELNGKLLNNKNKRQWIDIISEFYVTFHQCFTLSHTSPTYPIENFGNILKMLGNNLIYLKNCVHVVCLGLSEQASTGSQLCHNPKVCNWKSFN